MAATNPPLAHPFNMLLVIAPGDEEHFHAEPIQMGSAGLIDRM